MTANVRAELNEISKVIQKLYYSIWFQLDILGDLCQNFEKWRVLVSHSLNAVWKILEQNENDF